MLNKCVTPAKAIHKFLIRIHPFLTKTCYNIAFIYVVIKYRGIIYLYAFVTVNVQVNKL